jgi:hypothetical protein
MTKIMTTTLFPQPPNSQSITVPPASDLGPLTSDLGLRTSDFGLRASAPRRRGKIARLPKPVRERLNQLMDDGLPYKDILAALGPGVVHVTHDNLSNWYHGGFQDWLQHQERLEQNRANLEFAAELTSQNQVEQLHDLSLSLASLRICQLLTQFDLVNLPQTIADNPRALAQLVNAIARLLHETIALHAHREELPPAQQEDADLPANTGGPGIRGEKAPPPGSVGISAGGAGPSTLNPQPSTPATGIPAGQASSPAVAPSGNSGNSALPTLHPPPAPQAPSGDAPSPATAGIVAGVNSEISTLQSAHSARPSPAPGGFSPNPATLPTPPATATSPGPALSPEQRLLLSNDPAIWHRLSS